MPSSSKAEGWYRSGKVALGLAAHKIRSDDLAGVVDLIDTDIDLALIGSTKKTTSTISTRRPPSDHKEMLRNRSDRRKGLEHRKRPADHVLDESDNFKGSPALLEVLRCPNSL